PCCLAARARRCPFFLSSNEEWSAGRRQEGCARPSFGPPLCGRRSARLDGARALHNAECCASRRSIRLGQQARRGARDVSPRAASPPALSRLETGKDQWQISVYIFLYRMIVKRGCVTLRCQALAPQNDGNSVIPLAGAHLAAEDP